VRGASSVISFRALAGTVELILQGRFGGWYAVVKEEGWCETERSCVAEMDDIKLALYF
jgi:hypothetical protein